MRVETELLKEARLLWARGAIMRRKETERVARRLRPAAKSPGTWLDAVKRAHLRFLVEVEMNGNDQRRHVDAFFASLSAMTSLPRPRPMTGEISQVA